MPPIDLEITVEGKDSHVPALLGHAYQAGIGQIHRQIGVAAHEDGNGFKILLQVEIKP